MWQELDIAATTDIKAIRRAYAGRLRRIDVDRDPAAFQRLRQAFEAALRDAESRRARPLPPADDPVDTLVEEGKDDDIADPPSMATRGAAATDALEAPEGPAIADAPADETGWRELRHGMERALAAGDIERAFAEATEGMAQGLLSIDAQEDVGAALLAAAVDDRRLPAERFHLMAQLFGWEKLEFGGPRTALRERVAARIEAEAWFATLCRAAAAKGPSRHYSELQERLLARYLLGSVSRQRLGLVQTGTVRRGLLGLERCDESAPWLLAWIDMRRVVYLKSTYPSVHNPAGFWFFYDIAAAFWGRLAMDVAFPRRWLARHRRQDPAAGKSFPAPPREPGTPWSMSDMLAAAASKSQRAKKIAAIVASSIIVLSILAAAVATQFLPNGK